MITKRGFASAGVAAWCIASVCVAGGPAFAADPPPIIFAPSFERVTGSDWPQDLAAADFDGDGNKDLAALVGFSVTILLGHGDGTFDAATPALTGVYWTSIAVADFNHDGHPDLAVAQYSTRQITIAFGNGDGTFDAGQGYATGLAPVDTLAGDFDRDGRPDLLVGGFNFGMSVFLNVGAGAMGPRIDVAPDGTAPLFGGNVVYRVADLDRDGRDDIAVAGYEQPDFECTGGGFDFWRSLGAGAFSSAHHAGPLCPYAFTLADWDRDGRVDALNQGFNGFGVHRNLGGGAFATPPGYVPMDSDDMIAADFNLDGLLDLILPDTTDVLPLRAGLPGGTLRPETGIPLPGSYPRVLSDDFDNDGLPDLAVGVFESETTGINAIEVFLNRSVTAPAGVGEAASPVSAPLQVTGYDDLSGEVAITFSPACGATEHSAIYGSLESPEKGAYLGRVCNLGTSGTASFDPGAGSLFFLIVGNNDTIEGSCGRNSLGAERPESFVPATCDRPQVLVPVCP